MEEVEEVEGGTLKHLEEPNIGLFVLLTRVYPTAAWSRWLRLLRSESCSTLV